MIQLLRNLLLVFHFWIRMARFTRLDETGKLIVVFFFYYCLLLHETFFIFFWVDSIFLKGNYIYFKFRLPLYTINHNRRFSMTKDFYLKKKHFFEFSFLQIW